MSDHIDNAAQKEEVENMTVLKAAIEKQMEEFLINEAKRIKKEGITYTEPGSLNYLLYGSEPSKQSLSIKMGKVGERMVQKIITEIDDLELLKCGVQCIDPNSGKNKDLDLLWIDKKNRGGKVATIVKGFVGQDSDLKDLGKALKSACGVGGTAKNGEIIIQGNVRDKVMELLQNKGYNCKRVGA